MNERENVTHKSLPAPRTICSLVVARGGLLALIVGGSERWWEMDGYTFMPAELPAGELDPAMTVGTLPRVLAAIAQRGLGCEGEPLSSEVMYGPSTRHAIDKLALASDDDAPALLPLLQLERGMPLGEQENAGSAETHGTRGLTPFGRVIVRVYRVALAAEAQPGAEAAGLLWLAPKALRVALLGAPLAELLTQPGVEWQAAARVSLPDDAFIFVPADYGERHLLRIAAKYGASKLGLAVTAEDTLG